MKKLLGMSLLLPMNFLFATAAPTGTILTPASKSKGAFTAP